MNFLTENIALFLFRMGGPLDPDEWKDESKGIDFTEAPPDSNQLDLQPIEMADPSGLIVFLRYLAIAILAALLVYVIVRVIARRRELQGNKDSNIEIIQNGNEGPSATSPMDLLWSTYHESKKSGDYREAIRILHQIVIKHLDILGKVKAKSDKTNREYLREFEWAEKTSEFSQLTLLHEFIWYGGKDVEKNDFDLAEPKFLNFIKSIQNG